MLFLTMRIDHDNIQGVTGRVALADQTGQAATARCEMERGCRWGQVSRRCVGLDLQHALPAIRKLVPGRCNANQDANLVRAK